MRSDTRDQIIDIIRKLYNSTCGKTLPFYGVVCLSQIFILYFRNQRLYQSSQLARKISKRDWVVSLWSSQELKRKMTLDQICNLTSTPIMIQRILVIRWRKELHPTIKTPFQTSRLTKNALKSCKEERNHQHSIQSAEIRRLHLMILLLKRLSVKVHSERYLWWYITPLETYMQWRVLERMW